MDSKKKNHREVKARETPDDEPTNEVVALDPASMAATQVAEGIDESAVDPNVLALRRVDAEIRRLMGSWVDLENQLNDRDAEIRRLRDRGRSVEEEVQAARDDLATARSDCDRFRREAVDHEFQAKQQSLLQHEEHQRAETLRLELAAARSRIEELQGELGRDKSGREKLEIQLAEHRDAVTGMAAELSRFEKTRNGHDQEKAELAARIADMERRSTDLATHWQEVEAQLLAASRRAEGLESELAKARETAARLEKALEEKAAVAARLSQVQRELDVEHANSSALRKQLKTSEQAVGQLESALEHQRRKTEVAVNSAAHTEELLAEHRARLAGLTEIEAKAAGLGDALAMAEAAAIEAAGEREGLLATIAGLRERMSVLDVERAQLIAQLDEQRAQLSSVDSEFQAKRKSIAALSTEFDRLGTIQANVRKLDGMIHRTLSGGTVTDGETPPPRNSRLIVSLDGEKAVKYPLLKPDMVIGRSRQTDIRIAGPHASRRHARVFVDGGVVMIEDLGSLNGITVNETRVRKQELHDGDVLDVGGARLRFVDLNEKSAGSRSETTTTH